MSRFKKIFIAIAGTLSAMILAFVLTICNVKSNVGVAVGSPYRIVVFDHATTGNEFEDEKDFEKFSNQINNITDVSVFDKLVHGVTIQNRIYQDSTGKFSKWSTDLLNDNLVVEIIYDSIQDLIVYDGNDTRVVSYFCIVFVIPDTKNFTEIAVYYSLTSNSDNNEKYESYKSNTPLILYGNAKDFADFIKSI